jgi:hypothetical protein
MNALTIINERPVLALELPAGTSFDEWVEIGRKLCLTSKALQWHIGDWWAFGDHRYGQRAKAAAEGLFGREFQTIANAASVARAFQTSRRREVLSFSHHAEVVALGAETADELLEKAERDGWSVRDLRAEAIARKGISFAPVGRDTSPETLEWSALVGTWNRSRKSVRQQFIDEMNGTEPIEC